MHVFDWTVYGVLESFPGCDVLMKQYLGLLGSTP